MRVKACGAQRARGRAHIWLTRVPLSSHTIPYHRQGLACAHAHVPPHHGPRRQSARDECVGGNAHNRAPRCPSPSNYPSHQKSHQSPAANRSNADAQLVRECVSGPVAPRERQRAPHPRSYIVQVHDGVEVLRIESFPRGDVGRRGHEGEEAHHRQNETQCHGRPHVIRSRAVTWAGSGGDVSFSWVTSSHVV